jgi:predicted component of viral defense system (DUF524 family)
LCPCRSHIIEKKVGYITLLKFYHILHLLAI